MKIAVMLLVLFVAAIVSAEVLSFEDLPAYSPDATTDRSEVPDVYKWSLSELAANDEAWAAEFLTAVSDVEALEGLRGDLEDPVRLARYLQAYFKADEKVNRLTQYANLKRDSVGDDSQRIANHQKALAVTNQLMEEGPAIRRAVLSFDDDEMARAYKDAPALGSFEPFIRSLRRRASRVLTPEGERVLSLAGDNQWAQIDLNELPSSSENAFVALLNEIELPMVVNEKGEEVQLTFSNYGRLRASADRDVRRRTVEAMFSSLRKFEATFAATLAGQASFDVFLARSRTYDSALEAYLDKDDVDAQVYRTLVDTVRQRASSLHRYVELRRQLMGVDKVHLYDLYVPLVEGVERDIPYAEGVAYILEALEPLGEVYIQQAAIALDPRNGWIDVYPSKAKGSGAFSASVYGRHPFIKMNYQDSYDDVSTLAHELGHALHSQLAMSSQSSLEWRYPPFIAEIASTCNEMLLSNYMIKNATTDQERAWLLSELAESIRTTIFRQTMFADFELQVHELVENGKPVTSEAINRIYRELVTTYYGPSFKMDKDDEVEWAYIPHFYWKFYVYNYATGLSSGIALAEKMRTGGDEDRTAYLAMLRGGCSRPPLDLLRSAGVDLTRKDAINAALDLLDKVLDQLEELAVKN